MDPVGKLIDNFLAAPAFAVVGASDDSSKYGHKCYVCYKRNNKKVYPVNPRAKTVMGDTAYPDLASLPEKVESVSVITPPAVTEKVVADAIASGVKNIWLQPGAESQAAVDAARKAGLNVIAGGPCLLIALGYHE